MKKITSIITLIILSLLLFGCKEVATKKTDLTPIKSSSNDEITIDASSEIVGEWYCEKASKKMPNGFVEKWAFNERGVFSQYYNDIRIGSGIYKMFAVDDYYRIEVVSFTTTDYGKSNTERYWPGDFYLNIKIDSNIMSVNFGKTIQIFEKVGA